MEQGYGILTYAKIRAPSTHKGVKITLNKRTGVKMGNMPKLLREKSTSSAYLGCITCDTRVVGDSGRGGRGTGWGARLSLTGRILSLLNLPIQVVGVRNRCSVTVKIPGDNAIKCVYKIPCATYERKCGGGIYKCSLLFFFLFRNYLKLLAMHAFHRKWVYKKFKIKTCCTSRELPNVTLQI